MMPVRLHARVCLTAPLRLLCFMLVVRMGMAPSVLEAANIFKVGELARKCHAGKASACSELTKIALEDRMPGVRVSAVEYLSDQAVLAKIALEDPIPFVRGAAVQKLTDLALLAKIAAEDKDVAVRGYAAQPDVKVRAAQVTRAVEPLIACLHDPDSRVRAAAADSLGKAKDPRALAPLTSALRDTSPGVQQSASQALGEIAGPAVEPLIDALRDPTWSVRNSAAAGLGRTKDPRAVEPLIATLKDQDSAVRRSAAEALGQFQDPRAVEPLRAARKDPDPDVRLFAGDALGEPRFEYAISDFMRIITSGCYTKTVVTILGTTSTGGLLTSGQTEYAVPLSISGSGRATAGALRPMTWCSGALHTIATKAEILGYTFLSDPARPLIFSVWEKQGYVFFAGHGTVTSPSGHTVHLRK